MFFQQIHRLFSFKKLLILLLSLSVGIQIIIITYNNLSGYYVLDGVQHFFQRLLRGTLLSLLSSFLITYPDLFIIQYLNRNYPWGKSILKRIPAQLGFTVLVAALIAVLITALANWIKAYTDDDISKVFITNILIYAVINIIVVAMFEALIFFIESDRAKQKADHLQEELSQIKFEVLKSQINPHFMFNSLNVLSGLINKDINKAQQFIDEFSHIYRYVLETIEQPVATVGKELDFTRSYLFLQQIRYGNDLSYTINLPADFMEWLLPPLSLQVVLENATKHNIVNETKPLRIEIFNEGFYLVIKNNIQPKISKGVSTGLGLKNLVKRYAMISDKEPLFLVETSHYIAKLPLIKPEKDECINH
jgi:two-component system LytT family sensor kinase